MRNFRIPTPDADRLGFDLYLGLSLKIAGATAAFGLSWLIAHTYGAATLGLFQLGLATAVFLGTIATQGLDRIVMREVGKIASASEHPVHWVLLKKALNRQIILGIPLAIALTAFSPIFSNEFLQQPNASGFLILLAPIIVLFPFVKTISAFLRVKKEVLRSQLLDGVTYTSFACLCLAFAWIFSAEWTNYLPAFAYTVGMLCAVTLNYIYTRRRYKRKSIADHSLPFTPGMRVSLIITLNLSVDLVAMYAISSNLGATEVGIYRVAIQFCLLFGLIDSSFTTMAAPYVIRHVADGNIDGVKSTVIKSAKHGALLCLPALLAILFFSDLLLSIFGQAFTSGATPLKILAIGQFFSVACGPIGEALILMGKEKVILLIELLALALALATIYFLLPIYGLIGAAMAAALAITLRNALPWAVFTFSQR